MLQVYLIWESKWLPTSNKTFLTKIGKFSNSVLPSLFVTLRKLFSLCLFMFRYIFPVVGFLGVMQDFHLSSKTFLLCHFSVDFLPLNFQIDYLGLCEVEVYALK